MPSARLIVDVGFLWRRCGASHLDLWANATTPTSVDNTASWWFEHLYQVGLAATNASLIPHYSHKMKHCGQCSQS